MAERLQPGVPVEIASGVRRLVAPNPGLMTGAGTNTYLLGTTEIAVIDPGPAIGEHVERIVACAAAPIRWILVTHTHPDHSPAVAALKRRTGAETIGIAAPGGPHQDTTFRPDRTPANGERIVTREIELTVLHTPGHASNHLCYLDAGSQLLFTGDHIINGSTVVIDPPDGNMNDYLRSLKRLKDLSITAIAGGHGEVIDNPFEAIEWLIQHRLQREAKVIDKLGRRPGALLSELVAHVYDEVDPAIHGLAERSLLAHLQKLREDGTASVHGDRWQLLVP
ncbi:MAG: MBL fold metallo-hydrolase [Pseudomonadota bacterium]